MHVEPSVRLPGSCRHTAGPKEIQGKDFGVRQLSDRPDERLGIELSLLGPLDCSTLPCLPM